MFGSLDRIRYTYLRILFPIRYDTYECYIQCNLLNYANVWFFEGMIIKMENISHPNVK